MAETKPPPSTPCKRRSIAQLPKITALKNMNSNDMILPHPYGVRDETDLLLFRGIGSAHGNGSRNALGSIGSLRRLPDEELLLVLTWLDATSLCFTSSSCRGLYVFCHSMGLWRSLCLQEGNFRFERSWKDTYFQTKLRQRCLDGTRYLHRPLQVQNCYSTVLYRSWLEAVVLRISSEWLRVDNVDRRSNLGRDEFVEQYANKRLPVVLTDVVTKWPAFKRWKANELEKRFGDTQFRISASTTQSLSDFLVYCRNCETSGDERPLYLFDKDVFKKCPEMEKEFSIPEPFADDLMQVLGAENRPDYRWLIMGPARSGSNFHVDPNNNYAWNACIQGRKKWILYPPDIQPPGLDNDNISIVRWFHEHYEKHDDQRLECVTGPGDLMFVPRGWWHCVLNLEFCVALTHNVVSRHNLYDAVEFLRTGESCPPGYGCRGDISINLSGDVPTSVIFPYPDSMKPSASVKASINQRNEGTACPCIAKKRQLLDNFENALSVKQPGLLEEVFEEQEAKVLAKRSVWSKLTRSTSEASESTPFTFL